MIRQYKARSGQIPLTKRQARNHTATCPCTKLTTMGSSSVSSQATCHKITKDNSSFKNSIYIGEVVRSRAHMIEPSTLYRCFNKHPPILTPIRHLPRTQPNPLANFTVCGSGTDLASTERRRIGRAQSLKKVESSWSLSLAYFPGADFPWCVCPFPYNAFETKRAWYRPVPPRIHDIFNAAFLYW